MPVNRRDIPRADRINAILDVATRLFLERGFNQTTVADVARQAGVRNGTVHWYFPSKDDLLAAVVQRAFRHEYERATSLPDASPRDQLIRFLTDLRPFRALGRNLRDRADASESVKDVQRETGAMTRTLVVQALETGGSWCDTDVAADIILSAFAGNTLQQDPRMYGTEMVEFLLDRVFIGPGPDASANGPAGVARQNGDG